MLLLILACTSPPPQPAETVPKGVSLLLPADLKALVEGPGKSPRIYNFWATWCGPCVKELPEILAWSARHPEIELTLVNVDLPKDKDRKVVPFMKRNQLLDVRVVQLDDPDPAGVLPRIIDNWPDAIPVTLIVGADGSRVRQFNGDITGVQLDGALELLSTPPAAGIP